jgi:diguanylate cyclase (GGDEF)-like protein
MGPSLLDKLRKADQLPTAPGVALRIVELNRQDEVDIDDLAELLGQDPALAAKVIKTANSSMFGVPREVTSLRQAVLVLGLRTVNLLALSFSVISASSGRAKGGFCYRTFWTQTGATAMGSRLAAERIARDLRDEAFLAGLLARFGQLVLIECAPEEYAPVLEQQRASGGAVHEIERAKLGTTYAEIGAQLLDSWGLPHDVCAAIRVHIDPSQAPPDTPARSLRLAQLIHFAAQCAGVLTGAELATAIPRLQSFGESSLGFDAAACGELLTGIQQDLPGLGKTLGLELSEEGSLLAIRQAATDLLLRESLALQQQVQSVSTQMSRLAQQQSSLEERASTDALTGLRNRGHFDERMSSSFERLKAGKCSLGLLMVDIDHFKSVNDDYGHAVGDEVLKRVAQAIRRAGREQDACCRYGGEEFAVICLDIEENAFHACAEQIRESIGAERITTAKGTIRRTASVGGCYAQRGSRPAGTAALIEAADRELYRAKQAGRNCSRVRVLS